MNYQNEETKISHIKELSDFEKIYEPLTEYFNERYALDSKILFDIEQYLTARLTPEEVKRSVYKAIMTLNHFPSPKELVELIKGTPEQRAYRQWGKILERWEEIKGRKRVSGLNFLKEDITIDENTYTTLTILGFLQSTQWEVVYGHRHDFVKTYTTIANDE